MAANKLPPQINTVSAGDDLVFFREASDGQARYHKSRKLHVLDATTRTTAVLCAFHTDLTTYEGWYTGDLTFTKDGFKFCRWVPRHLLILNCRRIVV